MTFKQFTGCCGKSIAKYCDSITIIYNLIDSVFRHEGPLGRASIARKLSVTNHEKPDPAGLRITSWPHHPTCKMLELAGGEVKMRCSVPLNPFRNFRRSFLQNPYVFTVFTSNSNREITKKFHQIDWKYGKMFCCVCDTVCGARKKCRDVNEIEQKDTRCLRHVEFNVVKMFVSRCNSY